jgi:hypothetical protein
MTEQSVTTPASEEECGWVFIEVSGGVSYAPLVDAGVSVLIWDWDDFNAEGAQGKMDVLDAWSELAPQEVKDYINKEFAWSVL